MLGFGKFNKKHFQFYFSFRLFCILSGMIILIALQQTLEKGSLFFCIKYI